MAPASPFCEYFKFKRAVGMVLMVNVSIMLMVQVMVMVMVTKMVAMMINIMVVIMVMTESKMQHIYKLLPPTLKPSKPGAE